MPLPCANELDTAARLLDFGVLPEAAEQLVGLHRCARSGGCASWQACSTLVERLWQDPAPPPAGWQH